MPTYPKNIRYLGGVTASNAPRRQIAEYLIAADEDPAVAGRIALVPFDPVIGNRDTRARVDVPAPERRVVARVGDDGDILVVLDLEIIAPIGVRFSAA